MFQVSRCRGATVGQELLHDVEEVSWDLGTQTPVGLGSASGVQGFGFKAQGLRLHGRLMDGQNLGWYLNCAD